LPSTSHFLAFNLGPQETFLDSKTNHRGSCCLRTKKEMLSNREYPEWFEQSLLVLPDAGRLEWFEAFQILCIKRGPNGL
jgi:hypothetical protein